MKIQEHLKPFVQKPASELTKLEYVATQIFVALIQKKHLDERSMTSAISYAYELLLKCKEHKDIDTKQMEVTFEYE